MLQRYKEVNVRAAIPAPTYALISDINARLTAAFPENSYRPESDPNWQFHLHLYRGIFAVAQIPNIIRSVRQVADEFAPLQFSFFKIHASLGTNNYYLMLYYHNNHQIQSLCGKLASSLYHFSDQNYISEKYRSRWSSYTAAQKCRLKLWSKPHRFQPHISLAKLPTAAAASKARHYLVQLQLAKKCSFISDKLLIESEIPNTYLHKEIHAYYNLASTK